MIIALTTVFLVERVVDQNGRLIGILVGLLVAVVVSGALYAIFNRRE